MKQIARRYLLFPLLILCLIVALTGCGSSGGNGGGGGGNGNATLGVYVTDAFSDQFSQVWVTLYSIEVSSDGATYQTVYSDPNGATLNITSLAGVAQLLTTVSVPAGTYTSVRVTFGDHFTLVPKGGGQSISVPVDDTFAAVANGKAVVTIPFNKPVSAGVLNNLIIDFKLATFELIGNKLRPGLGIGDDNGFDHDQHIGRLKGAVSNLTAGASFDLTLRSGKTVHVLLSSTTTVYSAHNGANVTLANGQTVEVRGTVDPATLNVTADFVVIQDQTNGGGGNHDGAEVEGTVQSVDATALSFVVSLTDADHFQPSTGTVTVQTDANTVIFKHHHGAAQFSDIAASSTVEASGTYDSTTNVLTARRVELK